MRFRIRRRSAWAIRKKAVDQAVGGEVRQSAPVAGSGQASADQQWDRESEDHRVLGEQALPDPAWVDRAWEDLAPLADQGRLADRDLADRDLADRESAGQESEWALA